MPFVKPFEKPKPRFFNIFIINHFTDFLFKHLTPRLHNLAQGVPVVFQGLTQRQTLRRLKQSDNKGLIRLVLGVVLQNTLYFPPPLVSHGVSNPVKGFASYLPAILRGTEIVYPHSLFTWQRVMQFFLIVGIF